MKHRMSVVALAAFASVAPTVATAQITLPTVPIASAPLGYGYRIATHEVTNVQYAAFLNAVAANDSFSGPDATLYSTAMAGSFGGITRSGSAGSYSYAVVPGRENHPVVYVSIMDAMRFTNWLHNGQGAGGTESGAYTIGTGLSETRNPGALYFLPTMSEWYVAAYHQPASQGGDSDDYWLYPTSSNTLTTAQANYGNAIGNTTPVGSYAANFYGTFDMAGNAMEWTESIVVHPTTGVQLGRRVHGGSWAFTSNIDSNSITGYGAANFANQFVGFRVATIVPTPGAAALGGLGIGGLASLRRRR